ncbi:M56 family metallopeptidase [Parasphingopyxis lamellibrachiae]|uniref:Beta-lactamase regulating signal transducer with metallopeptidase domain n=1 Tax=Parasphingopyxis lamellibrachiae TaxID=680125 RepID=A0A3D9FDV5_9SPHN|nr:M56 family metallopeptidase [Parasphingopyxis lamellibrachiae]RED15969.1 beta-lactamase regulating signal transducer with metallopeptidase domain [Parasphingopyxis lamellibrachiae]
MSIEAGVIVDSLGWALLHSLWQVALVAALIFVALRIIPRHNAQLRFVTAYAGLAASFLLFIVTWGICYRTIGAIEPVPGAIAAPAEGWQAVINTLGRTTWLISLIWGMGFSWLGVRYGQALRATARLKHEGTGPVPADWEMRFRLWVERLGADPRAMILQSSRITTPLTIGTLKPIVLVPTGFFLRLPIDQAEAVLVHEIAHICRQDYLLGLIQALICNIFFYHPAIAYLSRQIDIEREYACDARVVEETGNTNALAQGLGKVALESRDLLPGFAMAADGGSTPLMDRITRLRERPFRRESATTMPFAALTLMLVGCLTIAASADASFSSNASKDGEEKDPESDVSEMADTEALLAAEAVATPETGAVHSSAARNTASSHHSAPKQSGSRSGDRWAVVDQQGWSFTPEPGWTFTFRGTGESESKNRSQSFEPVRFEAETGSLLRNAVLQTGIFDPDTVLTTRIEADEEECEDKSEQIADRHEREAERLEAQIERENARREARHEREVERAEARIERQMEREVAQFEREMERVEQQMERLGEIEGAELERELSLLATQMTALSAHLETRIEAHLDRARALADTARARSERSGRRHPSPSVLPEPPEPPQPVITISFNLEDGRAAASAVAASAASAEAIAQIASITAG